MKILSWLTTSKNISGMLSRNKSRIFYIGLFLVLAVPILMSNEFYRKHNYQFDEKINLVEIVTLIVTIILAIYIPAILEHKLNNDRFEKDTVIKKIETIQKSFNEINILVTECVAAGKVSPSNRTLIVTKFTSISNDIYSLQKLANLYKPGFLSSEITDLTNLRGDYKKIVTGGDFDKVGFKYDPITKQREEVLRSKTDEQLCLLIFSINRA
jgi:hypothetical protein